MESWPWRREAILDAMLASCFARLLPIGRTSSSPSDDDGAAEEPEEEDAPFVDARLEDDEEDCLTPFVLRLDEVAGAGGCFQRG